MRYPLNREINENCHKKCTKNRRREITTDGVCTEVYSVADNQIVRCVGDWAEQKIYHLIQYFGIFSNAMKNKWWGGINYIEICSGPGRCINRETGEEIDGTSLAIVNHKDVEKLNNIFFFDFDTDVVKTLNDRIKKSGVEKAEAFIGDYTDEKSISSVLESMIGKNSLNLVFIYKTYCIVHFSFIEEIKNKIENIDLIVNVASGTDFNRNIGNVFLNREAYSKAYEKYRLFLNDDQYFASHENMNLAKNNNFQELRLRFRDSYKTKLMTLGFKYFDFKKIKHYYDLVFVTRSKLALEFWKKANMIEFNGQRLFPYNN